MMAEPVTEEWRCERNDGKRWRCKKRRKDDDTLCEHHYAEKMAKCGRGAFTSKSRRHRGGKVAISPHKPIDPTVEGLGPDEKDDIYPPGFGPSTSDGEVSMDKTSTEGACLIVGPNERDPVVDSTNMVEELCISRMSKAAKKKTSNSNLCSVVQEKNKGPENKLFQSKVGPVWCHQCHMSDKGRAVSCMYCKKKQYCARCMTRWYPHLSEMEFSKKCPLCRNNCNCKACLRNGITKPAFIIKKSDIARHSYYVIHMLVPWLKELRKDRMIEKEFEATIKGLEPTELKLQQVVHQKDDRVHCNNCRTSIFDFHRSCPNCSYALCLICCRELHRGLLPGRERSMTCGDWKTSDNGNITCPPKEAGGCGSSVLELKCIISEEDILGLEQRVTAIVRDNSELTNISRNCSCFTECRREAAYRDGSDDNYLYCPNISDVQKGELSHFQNHWVKGEPVIVRDVLEFTSGLSWEPIVLWRAFREMKSSSKGLAVKAIGCQDWCEAEISLHNFFSGYAKGRSHANQCPQMFKLKDWPPDSSFGEGLQRHGCEFIAALPFQEYTHPRYGLLNLAVKLPEGALQPNLGPKTYIAHGHPEELGIGDSVTKLHCHMYDTVNVLVHTTEVTLSADQPSNAKKLKKRRIRQDTRECQQLAETENLEGKQGTEDDDHMASEIYLDSSKKKPKMKTNGNTPPVKIRRNLESCCRVKEVGVDANLECSSFECTEAPDAGGNSRKIVDYNGILKPKMKIGKLVIDCTAVELQSKQGESTKTSDQKDVEKQTEAGRQIPETSGIQGARKAGGGRKNPSGRKSKNSVEGNHSSIGKSENHVYDGCGVQKGSDLANSKRNRKVGQTVVSDDTTDNKQRGGGALWDVFRREDVPKLQSYLTKYSRELRHVQDCPVEKGAHPIHDQCFYLTVEHKKKLKDEYGIEPWTFEQNLGEAILIPAGCPHQVRNLTSCIKIALDFVSPESLGECIRMGEEFQMLPEDHRAKEDELEVKKIAFHAICQAVKDFEDCNAQLKFKAEVGEPSLVADISRPLLSTQLESSLIEAQARHSSPTQVNCLSQLFPIESQTHHSLSSQSLQSSPVEAQTHPSLSSQSFQPWLVEADACQPSLSQNLCSYRTETLDSLPPLLKNLQCSPMETYPSFPWRPQMAEGQEIRDEASVISGTGVSPGNHECRLLLWKPTSSVDDPTVKGVVYERKGKATLISDKRKRNHLVAHVSSIVEVDHPIKASSVGTEMILGQKEKLSRCPSMSDPPSSDSDLPLANEANREHYPENEGLDSNFLMVTPINEIPPEIPDPPTQNVKHKTPSLVKCNNMFSTAKSEMAAASPKEHDKHNTSSSRSAAFSISVCMEEMKKYNDIAVLKRVKAAKELQNKNWRETFMCMDDEMRRVWMESLE